MKMLRPLLKRIFPRMFLKKAFLMYNVLKSRSIDKLVFRKLEFSRSDFVCYQEKNPYIELGISSDNFPRKVNKLLEIWENPSWVQDQYFLKFNSPGWIEPGTGWAMSLKYELIYPSLGFASAEHVHKPPILETFFLRKDVVDLDNIVSLRDTGEENYFHFYNDVVAKLFFLEEQGIDLRSYQIVVSHSLATKQYFKAFLSHPDYANLSWHVQAPKQWIRFKKALFCKPFTHTKRYFDRSIHLLSKSPSTGTEKETNIFLTRSKATLRWIENLDILLPILAKFDFQVVDAAALSLEEQISTFRHCRNIIAIHGAGLTNMIFRQGQPMHVIEIIPPGPYVPFHYIMLAKLNRFTYDILLGSKGQESRSGGFLVEPSELETMLDKCRN